MEREARYLYCIIRCREGRPFDGVSPVGGGPGPVFTVPLGDLAMVVSEAPEGACRVSRANIIAHERVLERVMREYTLLPVRFGTVTDRASAEEDIRRLLARRGEEFQQLLARMEGRVELGLKAMWMDEKGLFAELLAENPHIRQLRDNLRGKPAEVARYAGIGLGKMVKETLEQKKSREAAAILEALQPISHDSRQNSVLGDRMIVNAAFLVDVARGEEFDSAVGKLEARVEPRVSLKYVGPVPPYNFVNIVVDWGGLGP
ncbi:MAG: GvpL/GvpF family gas vesicle protein [Chloroflexi bacterium]|nr:GvpL/GvpF family gas vesicle protein [Chloroflexota bacterium]